MKNTYTLKKAAIINASGKYITIILQLFVNAVLSRLLTPDDYGIVAVITVFSTFFISLSDMGFGAAIVQRKDLKEEDINKIYAFTLFVAIILMLMFCILSFGIARFYKNDVYVLLGWILSISLFFNALNMVPNGIMNREKRFGAIAIRTICAYLIAAGVAILLAFCGFRFYSIAIQTVISSMIIFFWNLFETRPSLQFKGCTKSVKKVLNYSGFQFAFNIVNYLSRNLDNLLTGKFMGNEALGYYYKAYNLMLYPVNNLTGVISPVLHPLLSDYQNEKKIIYKKYMKIVKILFLVGCFVGPFCYIASDDIISILYGNQWQNSVLCFKILSFAILPQLVGSSAGSIYQSLGKTKLLFYNGVINTIITMVAIIFGVTVGKNIRILSMCVAFAYILHFFIVYFILLNFGFEYKIISFFKTIIKEILIYTVVLISSILWKYDSSYVLLSFAIKFIFIGGIYLVMLMITGEYKIFVSLFKRK